MSGPTSCSTRLWTSFRQRKGRALWPGLSNLFLVRGLQVDAESLQDRLDGVPIERLGAGHQVGPGEPIGLHVGDLLGEISDAVRAGKRRELHGAEHADRSTGGAEEPAARIARDARGDGVDVMAPAARRVLNDDALLRAEGRDAPAELRVAVGVDRG